MPSDRNPSNNSVLQALLDAMDAGQGELTVSDLASKMQKDTKLRATLQAKWDGHAYPDKAITFVKLYKTEGLNALPSKAVKVLVILGTYASQAGYIQVKVADLAKIADLSDRDVKQALKALTGCGAIRIAIPPARHNAPVYQVSPRIITSGTGSKVADATFHSAISIPKEKSIYSLKTLDDTLEVVHDLHFVEIGDSKQRYAELRVDIKKEPSTAQDSPSTRQDTDDLDQGKHTPKQRSKQAKNVLDHYECEGQMSFSDFPKCMPDADPVDDPNLPFND